MIDIDERAREEDGASSTWKTVALIAAAGIGAYVAYRWLSGTDSGRELGGRVRDGLDAVKQRADAWRGEGERAVGETTDEVRDDAYDAVEDVT